jgi:hypothetical protein
LTRHNRPGLCKLPSDAIIKARDDTAAQVNQILLTFVGTVIFCMLSLFTPDIALLVGGEKLNVPFAGPVSFFGFMLLGPAVLIVLRTYLQIYDEHLRRLDRIAQWMPAARTPILTPDKNPLLRSFRGFAFYLLLPLAILAFWWKAAVFSEWGRALAILAAAVIAMHLTLLFRRLSWTLRAVISLGAAILALAAAVSFDIPLRRPFNLFRANLSDQWLGHVDLGYGNLVFANLAHANLLNANLVHASFPFANLTAANLSYADLTAADLFYATLTGANLLSAKLLGARLSIVDLSDANLTAADLSHANLMYADLSGADLTGTDLSGAILIGADLPNANLSNVKGLTQQELDMACGDERTQLPPGFNVKFCKAGRHLFVPSQLPLSPPPR